MGSIKLKNGLTRASDADMHVRYSLIIDSLGGWRKYTVAQFTRYLRRTTILSEVTFNVARYSVKSAEKLGYLKISGANRIVKLGNVKLTNKALTKKPTPPKKTEVIGISEKTKILNRWVIASLPINYSRYG